MAVYTLFGQTGGGTIQTDHSAISFGVQFSVNASGTTLSGIWWFSQTGSGSLPGTIALYQVTGAGTGTLIHSETPSWSGAAASGWVRSSFASPPSLTSGTNYKAVVFKANAGDNWYSETDNYWSSGAGSGGITNGPLSAPNNAGADVGQDSFQVAGTLSYPASTFSAANYWVDPEVTDSGQSVSGTVSPLALAAPAGDVQAIVPGLVSPLALAAPVGTPAGSGAATIAGAVAQLTLTAPAGIPAAIGGGGDDAPWHIRRRR